jgi:predicted ribosome quality control (RQC) complex YloA/Tae2 family protein
VGDADVQCAADLAAFFSKGRSDLKCDVIVSKAGALKKPKGAKPGQVGFVFIIVPTICSRLLLDNSCQ